MYRTFICFILPLILICLYSEQVMARDSYTYRIFPENGVETADRNTTILLDLNAEGLTMGNITLKVDGQVVKGEYDPALQQYLYEPESKLSVGLHTATFNFSFIGYRSIKLTTQFNVIANPVDPFQNYDVTLLKTIEQYGIDQLNEYRRALKLVPFDIHTKLTMAAQAHSNFLNLNKENTGHDEFSEGVGFTGESIRERGTYFGYSGVTIGEGIAFEKPNAVLGVKSLMDAPYHRLSIINPNYTEAGIGYNYEKNNVNGIVVNYGGEQINNSEVIIYPYPGQKNVKSSWFVAEEPNPLRMYGLDRVFVGYPISVSIHDNNTKELRTKSAIVKSQEGEVVPFYQIDSTMETKDLKHLFMIPKAPLKLNTTYIVDVELERVLKNKEVETFSKRWSFSTLPEPKISDIYFRTLKDNDYVYVELENGEYEDFSYSITKDGLNYQTYNKAGNRYFRMQKSIVNGEYTLTINSKHFNYSYSFQITVSGEKDNRTIVWRKGETVKKVQEEDDSIVFQEQTNVSPLKTWKITFNTPIDIDTLSKEDIYVTDLEGNRVSIDLQLGGSEHIVVVKPKEEYISGQIYYLYINKSIRSSFGLNMKQKTKMKFTIK